jgi:hypothetical protein
MRNAFKILVGRPERMRPFRRPRHRLENNITIDVRKIGFGVWIVFTWPRIGTGCRLL